jgi:hypothetical protein
MPYYIAFDIGHKPRGKLDENLTELRDFLNANDYICYNFLEVPITEETLTPYDILVFVCPDFARVSSLEISAIVNWVKNKGGGLLLLSHAGGDKGRGSNLSEISDQFGIVFENDQVLDEKLNLGLENIPLISTFNIPHPITSGIATLCYRSGSSLTIIGSGAFSIADSNESSEPFSCPLICVSEPEKGRVCCIGSYEIFRDKVGGGFQCNDNSQLALNIFKWLISDYRMELRANTDLPLPIAHTPQRSAEITEGETLPSSQVTTEKRTVDIDFSMNISKKSELAELLKIFQNQINIIKSTIDKLVGRIQIADDEIYELNNSDIEENKEDYKPNKTEGQKDVQRSQKDEDLNDKFIIEEDTALTALPPKPKGLKKEEDKSEESLEAPPKLKTKDKTKKELKNEKKGLETKLNSVQDLLKFIDKKHSSGKIDDSDYAKRSKKLENDLKKIKKRIDVLDKLLEK